MATRRTKQAKRTKAKLHSTPILRDFSSYEEAAEWLDSQPDDTLEQLRGLIPDRRTQLAYEAWGMPPDEVRAWAMLRDGFNALEAARTSCGSKPAEVTPPDLLEHAKHAVYQRAVEAVRAWAPRYQAQHQELRPWVARQLLYALVLVEPGWRKGWNHTARLEDLLSNYDPEPKGKRGKHNAMKLLAKFNVGIGAMGLNPKDATDAIETSYQAIKSAFPRNRHR